MTDPRLVAVLAEGLHAQIPHWEGHKPETSEHHAMHLEHATAILPAFLADPRTHEWLEERLVVEGYPEGWILRAFAAAILEGNDHD